MQCALMLQVIVKPLESLARRPRIWMKVIIAWVTAFIFASPQLFIFLQVRLCDVMTVDVANWR